MLIPGGTRDSAGRLKTTTQAGGTTPGLVLNGYPLTTAGRLLCDSNAVSGSNTNGAVPRNPANGNPFVATATAGTDVFEVGYRFSISGQLVVAVEGTPAIFVNGDGFVADGSLCTTEL